MDLIRKSLFVLVSSDSAAPTRDVIMAFATLHAFHQHWPSRSSPLIEEQLARWAFLKHAEKERFLKQRRIALSQLSADLSRAHDIAVPQALENSPLEF